MTDQPIAAPDRPRGRLLLLAGLGVPALGLAAYVVLYSLQRLWLPWYVPAAGLLGAALVVASLRERRTVWRALALLAVVLLSGVELAALYAMRLPSYAGPIVVGHPFPAFEAKRADGTPFTRNDLVGDRHHAIVFFRGRW